MKSKRLIKENDVWIVLYGVVSILLAISEPFRKHDSFVFEFLNTTLLDKIDEKSA